MSEVLEGTPDRAQILTDAHVAMQALLARRVDTEKRIFDQQNIPDTKRRLQLQLDTPESMVQGFWEGRMTDFLINATSFGSYCHEGRYLVEDFMNHWELTGGDTTGVLDMIAGEIVERYERSQCRICNDNYDDKNEGGTDE